MGAFEPLAEQHREILARLEALEADGGPEAAGPGREQAGQLVALLWLHAGLEERYLRPLLARAEGRARVRQEEESWLTVRELVEELEALAPGEPEWQARLTALGDLMRAHARAQEADTFPRLSAALGARQREELRLALAAAPRAPPRSAPYALPGPGGGV